MASTAKSNAEQKYAEIQKRDQDVRQEIQVAARKRREKTAKLRELRLAKEAEDAASSALAKEQKSAKAARKSTTKAKAQAH